MDYGQAEDLRVVAEREARGEQVDLEDPPEDDAAAREELRELVGRRRDHPAPHVPPAEPVDVTNVPTAVGLQRMSGKKQAVSK